MKEAAIAYLVIAVLTFGYAATNPRSAMDEDYQIAPASLMSAMVWPLYWSWEFFDLARDDMESDQ